MIVQCINYLTCGNDGTPRPACSCGESHVLCDDCYKVFTCSTVLVKKIRKEPEKESDEELGNETGEDSSKKIIKKQKKEPIRGGENTFAKENKQSLILLHLDVDQGACTLVLYTMPNGDLWTAVIDGGHGNPGRGQIVRYLKKLGRQKINALILSHHDADHADGLVDLLYHHRDYVNKDATLYVPYISNSHKIKNYDWVNRVAPGEDKVIFEDNEFSITAKKGNTNKDENGRSLGVLIALKKFKYLSCGDLPTDQGEDVVAQKVGKVDAVYCSHHGSTHSTSEKMLTSLKNPPIAVISAGRNGYGHPNSETIERFPKDPTKFHLYLTGCQFNRKYVNPEYFATELKNLTNTIDQTWLQYKLNLDISNAKNLAAALIDGLLFCIEEKHDLENAEKLKKEVLELLQKSLDEEKGMISEKQCDEVKRLVSKCFEANKDNKLPLFGIVSGTPKRMGPVGIRIQAAPFEQYVDIGFCFSGSGAWQWQHRWERGDDGLLPPKDINEPAEDINDAIPEVADNISGSPGKFKGWQAIRMTERIAFSLSTRTPRQPALVVAYKCRWCSKKESKNMVLVECEYCRHRGILVAYHQACFEEAMDGEKIKVSGRGTFGGAKHALKPLITELIEQRESEDTPVLIPAQYEACYQCGIFRQGGTWFLRVTDKNAVASAVDRRRNEFDNVIIGEVKEVITIEGEGEKAEVEKETTVFDHDATFENFYDTQPKFK